MTQSELDSWDEKFEIFHSRFAPYFCRREPREQSGKYMRGLLSPVRRKNVWQLAEAVGECKPDNMESFLHSACWDADAVCNELEQFVIEEFGDPDGIGIVDDTGFIKKGDKSAGVQRQYSGTAGKVENCQIGVFLTYAGRHGHTFLDRRLYMPEKWCADGERLKRACVPPEICFATKPHLATEMLAHAFSVGVPMRWVTGDEAYGDAPVVREAVETGGRLYVLGVPRNTMVYACVKVSASEYFVGAKQVSEIVAGWPESKWHRVSTVFGEKGPIVYDWAYQRVTETRHGTPGPASWLLARRSVSDAIEIAYYLSNAPVATSIHELIHVASSRYKIEQCFEEAKGETGLDEYEVRYWHSWHRHITLSMMAHVFLSYLRKQVDSPPPKMS
jgi:SRSO17 transposase